MIWIGALSAKTVTDRETSPMCRTTVPAKQKAVRGAQLQVHFSQLLMSRRAATITVKVPMVSTSKKSCRTGNVSLVLQEVSVTLHQKMIFAPN